MISDLCKDARCKQSCNHSIFKMQALPLPILLIISNSVGAINSALLTEAGRISDDSFPPSYRIFDFYPITQTERNLHCWICQYRRQNDQYRQDCDYLTEVRGAFRQNCPAGYEISQIKMSQSANKNFVQV